MARPGPWHRDPNNAVGPEALPPHAYEVRVIVRCVFCNRDLGEMHRYTVPADAGVPGYDNETTMISRKTDPEGTNVYPRQIDDEHEKWRFVCDQETGGCGRTDRPRNDARVERFMDELCTPWARRTEVLRL